MIQSARITTGGTDIFTAAKATAVTTIILCNVGNEVDRVTIQAYPSGGAPGTNNIILYSHAISPKRTFIFNIEKFILAAGDVITASTEKGNIAATISGMILE